MHAITFMQAACMLRKDLETRFQTQDDTCYSLRRLFQFEFLYILNLFEKNGRSSRTQFNLFFMFMQFSAKSMANNRIGHLPSPGITQLKYDHTTDLHTN